MTGAQPRPSSALRKQQHSKASYASNIKIKNNGQYDQPRHGSSTGVSNSVENIKAMSASEHLISASMFNEQKKPVVHSNHNNVIVQIVDMKDQKKRKKQLSQLFYGQNPNAKTTHGHSVSHNQNVIVGNHQHILSVGVPSQVSGHMYQHNVSMNSLSSAGHAPPKYASNNVIVNKANLSFSKK